MELTQSLQRDLVRDLKPKDPVVAPVERTIRETISLMQQRQEGCVIVCDSAGKAVGIFTERDVLRRVVGEKMALEQPIKDAMSTDLATVDLADRAMKAIELLHARGLRHLPVLDDSGQPVGIISVRRVMEYLVEHSPRAVYSQPPRGARPFDTREGA